MLFVVALDGLLQLCELAQALMMLQLLLALTTGEKELSGPRHWICFWVGWHSQGLDADYGRIPGKFWSDWPQALIQNQALVPGRLTSRALANQVKASGFSVRTLRLLSQIHLN